MHDIIASIVTFKNDKDILKKAIDSCLRADLKSYLYVIDNYPTDELKNVCVCRKNVEYIFNNNNLGFGVGHNIAIRKMLGRTKYSLILNPDVYFDKGTLEKLFSFMENNEGVGLAMPWGRYKNLVSLGVTMKRKIVKNRRVNKVVGLLCRK